MSNKSRSRKRKHAIKLGNAILYVIRTISEAFTEMKKRREKSYPKLAPGGTVYGSSNELIQGGEIVVPFLSKGAHPYENEPYLFQFND